METTERGCVKTPILYYANAWYVSETQDKQENKNPCRNGRLNNAK